MYQNRVVSDPLQQVVILAVRPTRLQDPGGLVMKVLAAAGRGHGRAVAGPDERSVRLEVGRS
jgi:hypothetical protein